MDAIILGSLGLAMWGAGALMGCMYGYERGARDGRRASEAKQDYMNRVLRLGGYSAKSVPSPDESPSNKDNLYAPATRNTWRALGKSMT